MLNIKQSYDSILSTLETHLGPKFRWYGNGIRRGPYPKFRDIEVIALSLTSEYLSINSELDLFTQIKPYQKKYFPNLICRRQYNARRKSLKKKIEELRVTLSEKFPVNEKIYVVDSTPAPVCRRARMNRCKIGKKDGELLPYGGYCAAQKEKYFGYKLHAIITPDGVIRDYQLTPANFDDRKYIKQERIWEKFKNCTIIGDMGYISKELKEKLFNDFKLDLQYPYRSNQKEMPSLPKGFGYKRKKIETIFSSLKDQFTLSRNLSKSFLGYTTRIVSKLCSLTMIQYINQFINKKHIGNIKNALI